MRELLSFLSREDEESESDVSISDESESKVVELPLNSFLHARALVGVNRTVDASDSLPPSPLPSVAVAVAPPVAPPPASPAVPVSSRALWFLYLEG